MDLQFSEEIKKLNSPDPSERRIEAEDFLGREIPDQLLDLFSSKLLDPDKGVRDAVASALAVNPNPKIPEIIVKYVSSSDVAARNMTGEILLKRGSSSVSAMLSYLAKCDEDDQKFLIDVLGLIRDDASSGDIIRVLKNSGNDNVILACIEALGNIANKDSVAILIGSYDKSELFKPTVIEALGKIGSKQALGFILNRYPTEDELTQFSMIETLGIIGDESTFFWLLSELRNTNGPHTWASVYSLKKLSEKLSLEVPFDEGIKNAILNTLTEGANLYKRAASELIMNYKDRSITEGCLRIYGEDEEIDRNIRSKFFEDSSAVFPLIAEYMKGQPENLKQLLELAKEILQRDSGESFQKLNEVQCRNFCDGLTDNLTHPDEEVRRSSIELLFFVNLDAAMMFLDVISDDDNYWNRLMLLEILEQIGDPRSFDTIKKLTLDQEEMVREKAEHLLNQLQQTRNS